jgi:dTDP-4-amino-4,6-dideoxygalactose transaminase
MPLLLPPQCRAPHVFNQYVLRAPGNRDSLQAFLKSAGVSSEVYYPVPMHLQECFAELGHRVGDFPNAEAAARDTLAVPIFPELTHDEIDYVCDRIVEYFRSRRAVGVGSWSRDSARRE